MIIVTVNELSGVSPPFFLQEFVVPLTGFPENRVYSPWSRWFFIFTV
jgi:hypothetical protein